MTAWLSTTNWGIAYDRLAVKYSRSLYLNYKLIVHPPPHSPGRAPKTTSVWPQGRPC